MKVNLNELKELMGGIQVSLKPYHKWFIPPGNSIKVPVFDGLIWKISRDRVYVGKELSKYAKYLILTGNVVIEPHEPVTIDEIIAVGDIPYIFDLGTLRRW